MTGVKIASGGCIYCMYCIYKIGFSEKQKIAATFAGGGDNIFVEIVILKINNLKFTNHSIINQNELESARLRNENFQLILL